MSDGKVQPFDSFTGVYKILIYAGFFKLLKKPKYKFIQICHQIYRPFTFLVILVHNLQHIIFIVQRSDNMDDVFDCLMIEIPQLNLIVKYLTVNLQMVRIEALNNLVNSPMFGANSKEDEEFLSKNNTFMNNLYKFLNISCTVSGIAWILSHFFRRYQDPNAVLPLYVPFDVETWFGYSMSVLLLIPILIWTAYGHINLDLAVAAYYAQAEVQLKIIKYNLEHMFDAKDEDQYEDESDWKENFVYYVQRFEKVAWFTKETNEVFSPAMFFQFFTCSVTLCCLVYRMSITPVGSAPFVFMLFMLIIVSAQVLLYCYFGTLVNYESQSIVYSLYQSNWLSTSPKFRRLLLIAMSRWSRPLRPEVSGYIPLSLSTFVSICRSAYSLYTIMGTKN